MWRYPLCVPNITADDEARVAAVVRSKWVGSEGPELEELANLWAGLHGRRYCVLTSSGTAALRLALDAMDYAMWGVDGDIVMPSMTFQATAQAACHRQWRPRFVDVAQDGVATSNAIRVAAEAGDGITTGPLGAILVALYGVRVHGCKILPFTIVDAAQAHGLEMRGDVMCHSFAANKIVSTGMGGALLTNDYGIAVGASTLVGHAGSPGNRYIPAARGHNCRMSNLSAALGVGQVLRLADTMAQRWRVVERYREHIEVWPKTMESPWLVTVMLPADRRDAIAARLAAKGVETRQVFPGLHHSPVYYQDVHLPMTDKLASEGLSLPTHPGLTNDDVDAICGALRKAMQEAG